MIDITKQYTTRDGRPVRLLCTDGPKEYPVIGIIKGEMSPDCWTALGYNFEGGELTLIEVKPKLVVERWINIFMGPDNYPFISLWSTEAEAIRGSNVKQWKVLARAIPFRWVEGDES